MLALLIGLLCWIPANAVCTGPSVKIFHVKNQVIPVGGNFNLKCSFTCLSPRHVAQMWRESENKDSVSLINITSTHSDITMELVITSATSNHSGNYVCNTQPPQTRSPAVSIQVSGDLVTTLVPVSSLTSSQQLTCTAGLQGQMWFWMISGKTIIFLIMFASLAVTHRRK